jgi:PAS domain-containing protein
MDPFFHVVERQLEQAERDGAFENLPGRGRPLELEDLSMVPPELRASWILLRSSGFVPPELEARKDWVRLQDLLAACADAAERPRLQREAQQALLRYRLLMERAGHRQGFLDYQAELLKKLER